jgi:hypothetical protein
MKKFKTILLLTFLTSYNTKIFASFVDDFDPRACNVLHVELNNGLILDRDHRGVQLTGEFNLPGNLIFSLLPHLNNGDIVQILESISFINHLEVGEELFDID